MQRLHENTRYFRGQLTEIGLRPIEGETPIVPILIGDEAAAIQMSNQLLEEGVYVIGFGYPVVPKGTARLRCQISAAQERAHLDAALAAMQEIAQKLKLI